MSLKKKVDKIPPDGWWSKQARDDFVKVGERLVERGFTEEEAIELLDDLYVAMKLEYGE